MADHARPVAPAGHDAAASPGDNAGLSGERFKVSGAQRL